jgi:hypothetical protein
MSKQSEAKEKQGFQKECPKCSNCKFFKSEKFIEETRWGNYEREQNIRCSLGEFKVGKSNWCNQHSFGDKVEEAGI